MAKYKLISSVILLVFSFFCYFVATQCSKSIMSQKVRHDMREILTVIDISYPGEWRSDNGLYKGIKRFNSDILGVEKLAGLSGTHITFFDGDTRIATTINDDAGNKIIGTKADEEIINKVLVGGEQYIGQVVINNEDYVCMYQPLKNSDNKTVGMLYVGLPEYILFDMQFNFLLYIISAMNAVVGVVELVDFLFTVKKT